MRKLMAYVLGAVMVAVVTIGAVFVVGMRAKSPPVINTVRRLGKATKAGPMRTAGQPGAWASVVRHVGRRTGHAYETPVGATATEDGFVIALPYGPTTDWVRNVLASGSATIVHDGTTYEVEAPEVRPLEADNHRFSAADQRAHRLFRVEQALHVRRVDAPA